VPKRSPSSETFRDEWRTGSWTPIDGVNFQALQGEAKKTCRLEMID
jgi:hypothetical protein